MNDSLLINKIDALASQLGSFRNEGILQESNRIISDSLLTHKLDSVSKSIQVMNHSLIAADSTKTILIIATFTTPLVVGLILFLLNRNKEHHSKKSELCGDIYGKIIELKNVVADITQNQIFTSGYSVIITIQSDEEYGADGPPNDDELTKEEYYEKYIAHNKTVIKDQASQKKIISELAKTIGQYRLYLPPRKRKIFDELVKPVQGMSSKQYSFLPLDTVNKVELEMTATRKVYRKDLAELHSANIDKLQNFIDENSGAIMFDSD